MEWVWSTRLRTPAWVAIEAARKVAENVRLEQIEQFPTVEFFRTIPILALTQFGRWDAILQEPEPPENLDYSNAIWHYARGTAPKQQKNVCLIQTGFLRPFLKASRDIASATRAIAVALT